MFPAQRLLPKQRYTTQRVHTGKTSIRCIDKIFHGATPNCPQTGIQPPKELFKKNMSFAKGNMESVSNGNEVWFVAATGKCEIGDYNGSKCPSCNVLYLEL